MKTKLVLCKEVFKFLFLFVLFLVGILLFSSCLRRLGAEHQRFSSLQQTKRNTNIIN